MKALRINDKDNVAVLLTNVSKDEEIDIQGFDSIKARQDISQGHKVALEEIKPGQPVIKYGCVIGYASSDICVGSKVHTDNIVTGLGSIMNYTYEPQMDEWSGNMDISKLPHSFKGYLRLNGEAGIRNEIWIIPTVACVNDVAGRLAQLGNEYRAAVSGNVEEVIAFKHPYGCSQTGEDKDTTERILADLATHPNAAGVLVLGLGCENSGIEAVKSKMGSYDESRVRFLVCQDVEDEIEAGEAYLKELIDAASHDIRQDIGIEQLIIGLKCGGSDGLSGITANPLLGSVADRIIYSGGSCIMTEVPEMFGAETLLMKRCENEQVFNRLVNMINRFKSYFIGNGQTIYENPSPGNKEGGISTLEDKSLGCTQKSGSSPVRGILDYGEKVSEKGLSLLYAPGNDPVAATALAAAHSQLILFSTGRGTPFAAPIPTMKISSNSNLAGKKKNWIDFDAGKILNGSDRDETADDLFRRIIECASGKKACSEKAGYHDMAIFKRGITL